MGRSRKFIRWLYSLAGVDSHLQPDVPPAPDAQPALDRQPRHQDALDPGRSLSVTVSFHRRGVQLEIASSAPAGHPGVTPAAAEVISETPQPFSLDRTPFWDALDPTEREALRAVASWQTFAAGAMIMREGDRADHVIVILGGRTRVSVNENGRERSLGERGVGQLVGEGGALRVGERSATVIALDLVWALVAETRDFAAFLTAHPRVLALVERQRYDRGIGESAEHDEGGGGGPADFRTGPPHRQPADGFNGLGTGRSRH